MADITKCRSGENYREGGAVTVQPVIADPSTKIININRGNTDKDWSTHAAIIAVRWDDIGYYYNEQP